MSLRIVDDTLYALLVTSTSLPTDRSFFLFSCTVSAKHNTWCVTTRCSLSLSLTLSLCLLLTDRIADSQQNSHFSPAEGEYETPKKLNSRRGEEQRRESGSCVARSIVWRTAGRRKHFGVAAFDSLATTTDRGNHRATEQTPHSHRALWRDRVHDPFPGTSETLFLSLPVFDPSWLLTRRALFRALSG